MQTIVGCDAKGFGRARLTWNGDGLGWAACVHRFVGSCAGWGMGMAALGRAGWARLVCGFVGSWVALGFGCVAEVKEMKEMNKAKVIKEEEGRKQERRQKSGKTENEEGRKGKQEEQGHPLNALTPDRPPQAAAY